MQLAQAPHAVMVRVKLAAQQMTPAWLSGKLRQARHEYYTQYGERIAKGVKTGNGVEMRQKG